VEGGRGRGRGRGRGKGKGERRIRGFKGSSDHVPAFLLNHSNPGPLEPLLFNKEKF